MGTPATIRVSVSGQAFCGAQLDTYLLDINWKVLRRGKGESHVAEVSAAVAVILATHLDLDVLGVDPELVPYYRAAQRASQKIRIDLAHRAGVPGKNRAMSRRLVWHNRVKLGTQPARIRAREDLPTLPPGTTFTYQRLDDGLKETGRICKEGWPFLERF